MRLCKISATCLSMLLILVVIVSAEDNVFERGKFTPVRTKESTLKVFKPPKPLVVISPEEKGNYPILFFIHGTLIGNDVYTDLFNFVASHGIIVVAPELFEIIPTIFQQDEIDDAAKVANWLAKNLNTAKSSTRILPDYVTADFNNFTVSGHSRGGKSAFALVLGKTSKQVTLNRKISALIGLDPVAGPPGGIFGETYPRILTNKPNSLDLAIPTLIIGTGLGGSCAPEGLNHAQFYLEAIEASHVVVTNYGHADMLNDGCTASAMRFLCGSGKNRTYNVMRKTTGGLFVAFFEAYFGGNPEPYNAILSNTSVTPTKLDPVDYKPQTQLYYDA